MSEDKKRCFIITPIGSEGSSTRRRTEGIYESVIKPVLERLDFSNFKASHKISKPGSITNQIIERCLNWELVITDLTDLNPNVMYELAVRHAVKKPVVIIANEDTDIPFDLQVQRVIFYRNDMMGSVNLQEELENQITSALEDEKIDNPIYQATEASIMKEEAKGDWEEYMLEELQKIRAELSGVKQKRSSQEFRKQSTHPHYILQGFESEKQKSKVLHELKKVYKAIKITEDKKSLIICTKNFNDGEIEIFNKNINNLTASYDLDLIVQGKE